MQAVHHLSRATTGELLLNPVREQQIATSILHLHDPVFTERGHHRQSIVIAELHRRRATHGVAHAVNQRPILGAQVLELAHVDFVNRHHQRLVGEQRFDGVKQSRLLRDRESALLTNIYYVQHDRSKMRQGGDGLHFNRVSFVQRSIQNSRRVQNLPPQVLVIRVTDVNRLRRERVRLHLNIRSRHLVHKARFTHIRIPAHQNRPRVRIDARQTRHVLSHLLQIRQARRVFFHDGAHPPQRRSFQLLTPVQRIPILEQFHVILRDFINHRSRRVQLP